MSNPEGLGRLLRAGLLVGLLVGAGIGVQAIVRPEPVDAPVEPVDLVEATDSDPSMDLAHLRGRDIEFLASVLREGTPEGRRSATRALLISGDARGVSVLFSVAGSEDDIYCEAALEIIREQTPLDAWRELAVAPEVCAVEDRLAVVEAQLSEDDIAALLEDRDGGVRDRARDRLSR
ncbi:MAG TPA: hypothetical protein QGF58_06960 [Myxococcota bacterium]|nr:hypothetical protein [Myxococcota bacterium]